MNYQKVLFTRTLNKFKIKIYKIEEGPKELLFTDKNLT
jgi:hypothetical protein